MGNAYGLHTKRHVFPISLISIEKLVGARGFEPIAMLFNSIYFNRLQNSYFIKPISKNPKKPLNAYKLHTRNLILNAARRKLTQI